MGTITIDKPQNLKEILDMLNHMLEEVQHEANRAVRDERRQLLIAKRNTLTELKMRIRDGRANMRWAKGVFETMM